MGKWRNAADEMYEAIQERKAKAVRAKKIADIQAKQILVERSLNAKAKFYKQRKK